MVYLTMKSTNILEMIREFNIWHYQNEYRFEVPDKKRQMYNKILGEYLDKKISLSISGLRRTGKTTILWQLINVVLDSGIKNNHVLYFQFSQDETDLNGVLKEYFEGFPIEAKHKEEFYIFLDELQFVDNWQDVVKFYVDINPKIKFVVTGSASIYWNGNDDERQESLAGRIIDLKLEPLSFHEMLVMRGDIDEQYAQFDIAKYFEPDCIDVLMKAQRELEPFRSYFNDYLRFGQFPALLEYLKDPEFCRTYLDKSIIKKILLKDLKIFQVEKEEVIKKIFRVCASNSGQLFNRTNTAREVGISRVTIDKYLTVLQEVYLVESVMNRLKSIRSQYAALDKIYLSSENLLNMVLNIDDPLNPVYTPFKGHVLENFVYNRLKGLGDTYYYNYNKKEVDFVVEFQNGLIPVEVKSTANLSKRVYSHLLRYMEKNDISTGYIVYEGGVQEQTFDDKRIILLPYWVL